MTSHHDVEVAALNLSVALQTTPNILQRAIANLTGNSSTVGSKPILRDVSVSILGPSLTAVVGPSGSGKTTLLNALSGRLVDSGLDVRGTTAISSSGQDRNSINHPSKCNIAYVRQEDFLLPTLTVRETLEYAAQLSLGFRSSVHSSEAVDRIISALGLGHCANVRIGDDSRKGCSGGEIRRVTIGVQILKEQQIMFLDEPTTGLDPKAASEIMQMLHGLVDHGKTIVVTLHQPRSEIWDMIDNLIVVSQGSVLYTGVASGALEHFARAEWRITPFENPFDFISDLVAVDTRDKSAQEASEARVRTLERLWTQTRSSGDRATVRLRPGTPLHDVVSTQSRVGFQHQLQIHCCRTFKTTLRDRLGAVAGLMEGLFMGLACGVVFYKLDHDLAGIKSRQGALYCTTSMQSYLVLLYETYRLTVDLAIFDREREDSIVSPAIFYFSRRISRFWIEDVPIPFVFSITFYFMAGLRPGIAEFFSYFLIQLLLHFISLSLAMCCAASNREFMRAALLANLNYVVQCLCAGLLINAKSLGPWIAWLKWGTHLRYAFGAVCGVEFTGNFFECPWPGGKANHLCLEYTGAFVMESLDFPARWFAVPVAALCGMTVLYSLFAIGLLHVTPSQRMAAPRVKRKLAASGSVEATTTTSPTIRITLERFCVRIRERKLLRSQNTRFMVGPVSAEFKPGTLTAIMAPSGSGKSTLLKALAGYIHSSTRIRYEVTGCVRLNGNTASKRDMLSACSFVPQHDSGLLNYLTVRQTLQYAARLRLSATLNEEEKLATAENVLRELGLTPCADTIVGSPRSGGLSGGEKRRLSIAIQVLTNPGVLLLDEPTSGLDAFTASNIVQALRKLADEGRTVVMVIHQPRWSFMQACTNVLLLGRDGQQAFFGSAHNLCLEVTNAPRKSASTTTNPADVALDRLAEGVPIRFTVAASGSSLSADRMASATHSPNLSQTALGSRLGISTASGLRNSAKSHFWQILVVLVQRNLAKARRAPVLLLGRALQVIGTGIIVVVFFAPLKHDTPSAQTRVGIIAQSSSLFFVGMLNAIALYPAELDLFLRESKEGVYGAEAFLLSYSLVELTLEIVSALLLSLLFVFATGLSDSFEVFLVIAFTSFAVISCGESLGIVFLSFIEHTGLAISIMSVVLSMCTSLNGAFSLNMVTWLEKLNSVSPSKWQVQASAASSLRGVRFSCDDLSQADGDTCPIATGKELLQLYHLDVSIARATCALAVVVLSYRILAYIALKIRCKILE